MVQENNTIKIFISEDDPDDQFIFRTAIREVNPTAQITFFFNSRDLIRHLIDSNTDKPESNPDLIIGDLKIPFFDLRDIAEIRVHDDLHEIPVFVFAESFSDISNSAALELGATEFFHKPNSLHRLKDIMRSILDRKKPEPVNTQIRSAQ
jgi:DNA-binding response OmpR family regulator